MDLIDDAYKRYSITAGMTGQVELLTREEFGNRIKTDNYFGKMWDIIIETRELREDERISLLRAEHGNKGHHIEAGFNMLDEFEIPTKVITVTYNGETQESYE